MSSAKLPPGKLPPDLLARVLGQIPQHDDRLLIGPAPRRRRRHYRHGRAAPGR